MKGDSATKGSKFQGVLKSLGPGIILAGAAIGGSHLVQSTRAGAVYGFGLLWAVVLANLMKYPFFQYSQRYTAATGESILHGYRRIGKWALYAFFALSLVTALLNIAGVTAVTAGLSGLLFSGGLGPTAWSAVVLLVCIAILALGHYKWLDRIMKIKITLLAIATVIALGFAWHRGLCVQPGFVPPPIWNVAGVTFLIALMGWMPAPIEISAWPSLWMFERKEETGHRPTVRESMIDFHTGYVATSLLALVFVGLGAFGMYGTGETFPASGVAFSGKLISLYTRTLGNWSGLLISVAAFVTMFSTTLACVDGYPRSLTASMALLFPSCSGRKGPLMWGWIFFLSAVALVIIGVFLTSMKTLITVATIVSFLAAPVFAALNYRVVLLGTMPPEHRPRQWLRVLSWMGIVFLSVFSLLFLLWRILHRAG